MTRKKPPEPPKHLSRESRQWFRSVVTEWQLDAHHIRLLVGCCEAIDRATEAREAISKDGPYRENRFGDLVKHPAIGVERDSWTTFGRLLRELDLDVDLAAEVKRPPQLRVIRAKGAA